MSTNSHNIENNENVEINTGFQEASGEVYSTEDIEKNKTMAGLAYLLFFLPLIFSPDSKYARFHANQGLLLLITSVLGNIILNLFSIVGLLLYPIFGIAILILGIMGFMNGFGGKAKPLPLIGNFKIL